MAKCIVCNQQDAVSFELALVVQRGLGVAWPLRVRPTEFCSGTCASQARLVWDPADSKHLKAEPVFLPKGTK